MEENLSIFQGYEFKKLLLGIYNHQPVGIRENSFFSEFLSSFSSFLFHPSFFGFLPTYFCFCVFFRFPRFSSQIHAFDFPPVLTRLFLTFPPRITLRHSPQIFSPYSKIWEGWTHLYYFVR